MLTDSESLLLLGMPEPVVAALINGDTPLQVFNRLAIAEDGRVVAANRTFHAARRIIGPIAVFKVDADVAIPATNDERLLTEQQFFDLPPQPSDGDEVIFANADPNIACRVYLGHELVNLEVDAYAVARFRAMGGRWFQRAA